MLTIKERKEALQKGLTLEDILKEKIKAEREKWLLEVEKEEERKAKKIEQFNKDLSKLQEKAEILGYNVVVNED